MLKRHGVSKHEPAGPDKLKPFKAYVPGYVHVEVKYLPQMADEDKRRYLFVAIDRATRWVFIAVYAAKTAANAKRFVQDKENMKRLAIGALRRIQKLPNLVRSFFQQPECQYAGEYDSTF